MAEGLRCSICAGMPDTLGTVCEHHIEELALMEAVILAARKAENVYRAPVSPAVEERTMAELRAALRAYDAYRAEHREQG